MSKELPVYQCHKRVKAFKIEKMIVNNFENIVYLASIDGHKAKVNSDQAIKHNPQLGWYYVEYESGYQSFSPAPEFEAGYTKLEDQKPGFSWSNFESKPTTRKAFQITADHEFDWFEDSKTLNITDGKDMLTAACHQQPKVGDYVVYLNSTDIYHCSETVFLERNIVPGH